MAATDAETWLQAIKSEMDSIHMNRTWELVELLDGKKSYPVNGFPIQICIRLRKTQVESSAHREGIQTRIQGRLWRDILISSQEDVALVQMDVKTTFLHGDMEEDIYMSQPAGFTAMGEDSHLVCRLKKSLYGLKQAPRMWYQKFDSYIRQLGYHRYDSDPCMYIRQLADEFRIYMILYVDDMLIAESNQAEIGKLKWSLHDKFAMKELGQALHILRMRIERNQVTKTLRLS